MEINSNIRSTDITYQLHRVGVTLQSRGNLNYIFYGIACIFKKILNTPSKKKHNYLILYVGQSMNIRTFATTESATLPT